MKSIFTLLTIIFGVALLSFGILAQSTNQETISEVSDEISSGNKCKWKKAKCPGWLWSESYEACLTNGDGNKCSCGSATRDC